MESIPNLNQVQKKFETTISQNIKRNGIDNLLDSLKNKTDFFRAPCSTKYHLNVIGGLVLHSLNVLDCLIALDKQYNLNLNSESMIVVALFHDLCKSNYYTIDFRNVKENNKWIRKEIWIVDDKFPAGHGEKSCFVIQYYMQLKPEELLAIRWHMGAFEAGIPNNYTSTQSFNKAGSYSKLVHALQIADQTATSFLEE